MGLSFWHMLLILIVVLIIFGPGKLPKVFGDVGKGIKNLRNELKADDEPVVPKVEQKDKP